VWESHVSQASLTLDFCIRFSSFTTIIHPYQDPHGKEGIQAPSLCDFSSTSSFPLKIVISSDFYIVCIRIGHRNMYKPKEPKSFQELGRWTRNESFTLNESFTANSFQRKNGNQEQKRTWPQPIANLGPTTANTLSAVDPRLDQMTGTRNPTLVSRRRRNHGGAAGLLAGAVTARAIKLGAAVPGKRKLKKDSAKQRWASEVGPSIVVGRG
jgi:hypothetical protein